MRSGDAATPETAGDGSAQVTTGAHLARARSRPQATCVLDIKARRESLSEAPAGEAIYSPSEPVWRHLAPSRQGHVRVTALFNRLRNEVRAGAEPLAHAGAKVQLYAELPDEASLLFVTASVLRRLLDDGLIELFRDSENQYPGERGDRPRMSDDDSLAAIAEYEDLRSENADLDHVRIVLTAAGHGTRDAAGPIPSVTGKVPRPWERDE